MNETRTYNNMLQLTHVTGSAGNYTTGMSPVSASMDMQYVYNAGHNNGRVAQTIDNMLGETVNYSYDWLHRLTGASATNGSWGEAYGYDGFGNLTAKAPTAGSAPAYTGNNGSNNTGGAMAGGTWPLGQWDFENRLVGPGYAYDPWGRRVWMQIANNTQSPTYEVFFYGATGQKLESYGCNMGSGGWYGCGLEGTNTYFAGKMLSEKGVYLLRDRLGSVRADSNGVAMSYFPWGEERGAGTANGRTKFAGYYRDAVGQDYAMARYYNAGTGAFWSQDPGGLATADPKTPNLWNRYAYVGGDPINMIDPRGTDLMFAAPPSAQDCSSDPSQGGCNDPCQPNPYADGLLDAPEPGCYDEAAAEATAAVTRAPAPLVCSVSLWERPTPTASSPGLHTYLSTTVFDPNTGVTSTLDYEGGPQPQWAFVGGTLTGTIAPPGAGLNSGSKDDATNPALPTNKEVGSAYTGADACGDIAKLTSWIQVYNGGSKVTYSFLAIGGYNSNSFAYTLDTQLGLLSYFGTPTGWVPGWRKLVPGL